MKTLQRLLILSEQRTGVRPLVQAARTAGYKPEWRLVGTRQELAQQLAWQPDLILCACSFSSAFEMLDDLQKRRANVPVICIGYRATEGEIVALLKRGAVDYIARSRMERLAPAIADALRTSVDYPGHENAVPYMNEAENVLVQAERLRMELAQQRELVELKEGFMSMVSHEFRIPLSIIISSADILRNFSERLEQERRVEHLNKIENQARRMVTLLDNILMVSRARSGKLTFHPQVTNLDELIHDILGELELVSTPLFQFTYTLEGDCTGVMLDPQLIHHILSNLLSNAQKYTPHNGRIALDIQREGDWITMRVSDTGIGIPEPDQKQLFQPFYRASNTGRIKGSGLGLSLARLSAEAHGGTITCESQVGQGTTFTVQLPIRE